VLPVLPIVLAGGASGGRRRPFAIVAGMLSTFVLSILFAAYVLRTLGLPEDLLRNVAIALLFLVAATLLVPRLGLVLERSLARFSRRPGGGDLGGGFVLGCALGLAFVPCGGPILAYVTAQAASVDFGLKPIALALSYGVGVSAVMLAIALGGQRFAAPLRAHAMRLRVVLGIVVGASALALVLNADEKLQTAVPSWTAFLQDHTERTAYARTKLNGAPKLKPTRKTAQSELPDYGAAPQLSGGGRWFNSPPLTMRALRGKVVLIDFWTYSCINCLRTLPHLEAWDARYRRDGLVIVGVHTPEFAFEHVSSNVSSAVRRLGVRYPVVQDNDYKIWNAYGNQYWPAEYLVDRDGRVRHAHFGEGEYGTTERLIRELLHVRRGATTHVRDTTPVDLMTPESYLGSARAERFVGDDDVVGVPNAYHFPAALPLHHLAFGGIWTVLDERAVTGPGARLRLHYEASKVYLVLGGRGRVQVLVNGRPERTVAVDGDRLYTLVDGARDRDALLELRFTPKISAYAFTFG
jgi:cytochrome c biogenesis protein CcdA/thiol-disulfide isomerase/thioredoxin